MYFVPLPGNTAAIPLLRPESSQFFVHPDVVDPWRIDDSKYVTSALKFGTRFDLLGLSHDDDLMINGAIDVTDMLDPNIALERVYYRAQYGDIHFVDLTNTAQSNFVMASSGNIREWTNTCEINVNKFGTAKSWLSRMVDKVYALMFKPPYVKIKITGSVNLETGATSLHASSEDPAIVPIGYTLRAFRHNLNRRPHGHGQGGDVSKCPYMN